MTRATRTESLTNYVREIVYGGTDGIITTFAVVAGFTGAQVDGNVLQLSFATVLLFGLANLFADSASMGLGNFLSIRAEKDVYQKRKKSEQQLLKEQPDQETRATVQLLEQQGFANADAQRLAEIYKTNPGYWTEFMMQHKHELPNPEGVNPFKTALTTITSFVLFGFIPLTPYLLSQGTNTTFLISILFTFAALILLGIARWRIIGDRAIRSIIEIVSLGGIAAIIAFIVGTLFNF